MPTPCRLDAAYRYSDYDSLTTDTYKVGMDWAPIQDVKFRGSYQKAVRAANVVELFTAQGFNLFDLAGDPCGADLAGQRNAASDAACLATGVPAAQLRAASLDSPAGQYNFLQGGNPDLVPEESETVTFGIILQPRFLPKLTMSVDYFNIEITDTISTFGSDNTLNACYFQGDADSCARINRDQNGNLWRADGFVQDLNINIGSLETTGYDLNVNYSGLEMGTFGSLNFNLTGTYLDELITVPGPGIDAYDCAGLFSSSCGMPNPEWRHHARLGWVDAVGGGPLAHVALLRRASRSSAATPCRSTTNWMRRTTSTWPPTGRSRRSRRSWSASTTCWTRIRPSSRRSARRVTATRSRRPTTRSVAGSSSARRSGSNTVLT